VHETVVLTSLQRGPAGSARRIAAMILRYLYILKGSWPRVLELAYWPTVQVILWGLISTFFVTQSSLLARAGGLLLAAVMLWDVLFRGQLGVSLSFMEEMWSRNLGNLAVAPLRPYEFAAALLTMSLVRTVIGVVPATLVAVLLYRYSIYTLGLPLLAFFANLLMMSWGLGLVICAILLRWGLGAESLAWFVVFAVAPICGVYYPISVLPDWLVPVAYSLPAAHVFEGMRGVMLQGSFSWHHFSWAVGLNAVYIAVGMAAFLYAYRLARTRGLLLQSGE
jgi:ABC-2 type transport system permease protein